MRAYESKADILNSFIRIYELKKKIIALRRLEKDNDFKGKSKSKFQHTESILDERMQMKKDLALVLKTNGGQLKQVQKKVEKPK